MRRGIDTIQTQWENIRRGSRIVVRDWLKVRHGETVLLLTDSLHLKEMPALCREAEEAGASVELRLLPDDKKDAETFLSGIASLLYASDVIIGAADYSIATIGLIKSAAGRGGARFLSLPLSVSDGRSMLAYDFLMMDPQKSRIASRALLEFINQSEYVRVETPAGTRLSFRKRGRKGDFTDGMAGESRTFASASFEVYIPVEETMTEGIAIVDGSLGYLGKPKRPFTIRFAKGRLTEIDLGEDGQRLTQFIRSFGDDRMYHVSELGIGLNFFARCDGNCYIEDESAYGTFHMGFGRNVTLGGPFEAVGHFDLVFREPTLYTDNRMLMEQGRLIEALPSIC